jgi:superfamily II DNA or RNA helicase
VSILRPYQRQAVDAAWEAITPEVSRVAIEMATGLGKTITFAALIDEWLTTRGQEGWLGPGWRALVLVHTDELVRQAVDKIRIVTKGQWSIGVVKAGQNETSADIVVASVQTLANAGRREQIQDVGLIIVDECHHATAPSYITTLDYYGAFQDHRVVISDCPTGIPTFGFTATLARSDGTGLGTVWQDLAFSRSLTWAIRQGWLIDLVPYTITIPGLEAGRGDAALDAQLADSIAPEAVMEAWKDRHIEAGGLSVGPLPSTVLFAPLVRSAEAFADAFNAAGVKAEVVHGALPAAERQAILQRYEDGTTTVICNAMVLTEGWDSPRTSCVIVARPTQSVPLFVQMIGRGLRPWLVADAPPREAQRCILLCVAGTTTDIATVADLSDTIAEAKDGMSLLAMEDEWDIGADIAPDAAMAYAGPVRVEQWDALVQRSSKAWKYTAGGVPFLPLRKRSELYVFIVQVGQDSQVWTRVRHATGKNGARVARATSAPDLELAMAEAEDIAQDMGGDIGALLADKTRAWRKAVPSMDMIGQARRVCVDEKAIERILSSKAGGKAGKLSDLIDTVTASRVLDHLAEKIKERGAA